jgi:hypothetical protein
MRKPLWLAVAMLLVGVGCPTEFGIEGRLDKAMEKDLDMQLEKDCPAGTHWEDPKTPCTGSSCKSNCVPNH